MVTPSARTKRARASLSHDQRRITAHYYGYADRARIAHANAEVGNASWVHPFGGIFGNLNDALHYMPYHARRGSSSSRSGAEAISPR
jgi:hypothetical protein